MARIVAVANQKGGVAKTTTVAALGAALAELGAAVLVVDLDPQACLTFSLGVDPENLDLTVHDVLNGRVTMESVLIDTDDGIDLVPAAIELAGTEAALHTRAAGQEALAAALHDVSTGYDWVLIDCPPTLGALTVNALTAADEVLIPLQCETLSHRGVGQLLATVAEVQRLTNPGLRVLGVLPTLFDGRTTHARSVLADIEARYDVRVLEPAIPKSVRFAEAPAIGRSVLATASSSPGAQAYRDVAKSISRGALALD